MENNDIYQNVEQETQDEPVAEQSQDTNSSLFDVEETAADTTPQEEFDIIKYNKEEVRIPVSERQTYLQKGYNYDKVQKQLEETKQQAAYIERIAKMQGFDNPQDFLRAVDEMEQQRRIETEAEKIGVDTETFKAYLEPMRKELEELRVEREKLRATEMQRQVDAEIMRLKQEHPDFEKVQDKVFDMAIEKGYALEDAYLLLTYRDKVKRAEQDTLAKVASRDQKQVLSSVDKASGINVDPSQMTSEQIREISQRVQRGERISF